MGKAVPTVRVFTNANTVVPWVATATIAPTGTSGAANALNAAGARVAAASRFRNPWRRHESSHAVFRQKLVLAQRSPCVGTDLKLPLIFTPVR